MLSMRFKYTVLSIVIGIMVFGWYKIPRHIYPVRYKEYVIESALAYNVDPHFIFAIIKAESGFNTNAISHKNAVGLMQLTESTAIWGADILKIKRPTLDELKQPRLNIKIGTWYVSKLMKQFNNNIFLVVAAYNAGSGNVFKWMRDGRVSKYVVEPDDIPFKETKNFVKRVDKNYRIYKELYPTIY